MNTNQMNEFNTSERKQWPSILVHWTNTHIPEAFPIFYAHCLISLETDSFIRCYCCFDSMVFIFISISFIPSFAEILHQQGESVELLWKCLCSCILHSQTVESNFRPSRIEIGEFVWKWILLLCGSRLSHVVKSLWKEMHTNHQRRVIGKGREMTMKSIHKSNNGLANGGNRALVCVWFYRRKVCAGSNAGNLTMHNKSTDRNKYELIINWDWARFSLFSCLALCLR